MCGLPLDADIITCKLYLNESAHGLFIYFYLFIYLFASDTHNLDHMHPYQLLVAVVKTSWPVGQKNAPLINLTVLTQATVNSS